MLKYQIIWNGQNLSEMVHFLKGCKTNVFLLNNIRHGYTIDEQCNLAVKLKCQAINGDINCIAHHGGNNKFGYCKLEFKCWMLK